MTEMENDELNQGESTPSGGDVGLRPLVRPAHVPEIGGCPSDCGHSDEEHAAFDTGLYDGEHGTTIPPAECCEDTDHSRTLRAAWREGYDAGVATFKILSKMKTPQDLINDLVELGGAIVSSSDCDHMELAFARSEGRFAVRDDHMGFVRRTKEWLALQLAREKAHPAESFGPNAKGQPRPSQARHN